MIGLPSGTRIGMATGATDMRKGFDGMASLDRQHIKIRRPLIANPTLAPDWPRPYQRVLFRCLLLPPSLRPVQPTDWVMSRNVPHFISTGAT